MQRFEGDRRANLVLEELANRLFKLYQNNYSAEWRWYENRLTYCNAVLPHALLVSGRVMSNTLLTEAGLESLNWLKELQRSGSGYFVL